MRVEGTGSGKRNAKRLRKQMTPPEIGLWLALRQTTQAFAFANSMARTTTSSTSTARLRGW
jgi:very-short-patch-repair endonuclease